MSIERALTAGWWLLPVRRAIRLLAVPSRGAGALGVSGICRLGVGAIALLLTIGLLNTQISDVV